MRFGGQDVNRALRGMEASFDISSGAGTSGSAVRILVLRELDTQMRVRRLEPG